ncbi:MAG TPA: GNAT family N-acetyltransferase [Anaerolineae bacterium]|nr:GNAT family N-acetyltransferase [Anaerolineae bacterium]
MTMHLIITPLQHQSDAQLCAEFMYTSDPWQRLQSSYTGLLAMFADESKEIYVAKMANELVGFMVLHMNGAFVGYLQTIGVFPAWQGRGIGRKLIAFAEKRVFTDSPNLFLCVSSFNKRAQKFYQTLGYAVVGELKDYLVAGHAEILMRKSIAPWHRFRNE